LSLVIGADRDAPTLINASLSTVTQRSPLRCGF